MTARITPSLEAVPDRLAVSPRQYNQDRLVQALRLQGTATRAELAGLTGLSRATVATMVSRLVTTGHLRELPPAAGASGPGRPAAMLCLTARSGVVIRLDFGRSHLRCAAADLSGRVLAERLRKLQVDNSADDALRTAAHEFDQLLSEIGVSADDIGGVVMGIPSPIERDHGRVVSNNILPGWVNRAP